MEKQIVHPNCLLKTLEQLVILVVGNSSYRAKNLVPQFVQMWFSLTDIFILFDHSSLKIHLDNVFLNPNLFKCYFFQQKGSWSGFRN